MRFPAVRARRLRTSASVRELVAETKVDASDLVLPVFVHDGADDEPIGSMPGVCRLSFSGLDRAAGEALRHGVRAMAVFPVVPQEDKSDGAEEAWNERGLVPRAVSELRGRYPELTVITDVALDPYTTHGHDGLLSPGGVIMNDQTVDALVRQALCLAGAGTHMVAPSDMMDGRVARIREALEEQGFHDTLILSYAAKYASAFYGPFRDAIGSAANLKGDKKTYQMDPRNVREAAKEVRLDVGEGADIVMVKPGLPYLDVIAAVRAAVPVPVFAYQVSGEHAMIEAAAANGWIDRDRARLETVVALRRAGADCVLTYFATEIAKELAR